MKFNTPRYIWLPIVLTIYTIVMAYMGRDILLVQGNYLQFFGIIAAEAVVIIALAYFLHRKYILKKERELQSNYIKKPVEK